MGSRLVGYEPSTKFQNLRCEKISSLRLKSAKLKKKTYYHAFLRKILAFNLKIIIISEHVCEFRPVTICQRNVNRGNHRQCLVSSGLILGNIVDYYLSCILLDPVNKFVLSRVCVRVNLISATEYPMT